MSASLPIQLIAPNTVLLTGVIAPGVGVPVAGISMLVMPIKVVYNAGTFAAGQGLHLWLVGSQDQTNWYDTPYDMKMITSSAVTDVFAVIQKRNICDAVQASGSHIAIYQTLPWAYIAMAGSVTGSSSPSFTVSAVGTGK